MYLKDLLWGHRAMLMILDLEVEEAKDSRELRTLSKIM